MADITHDILEKISDHIREAIGIYFPKKKFTELKYKLLEIKKELDLKSDETLIAYITKATENKEQTNLLAQKFTIGETYFWRDRELFRVLEETIIPGLIDRNKRSKTLRIWSAASSTGEEAYSIAILLRRLIPNLSEWNITILATDINPVFIHKAQQGKYTEWSFRSAPPWLKENYFTVIGKNEYLLDESIKKMVTFSYLNLILDNFPSLANNTNGMDLIFCRNVLMYFKHEDIKKTSDKLYNCLVDGGFLLTTPSESFQYLSPRFKVCHFRGVSVYQRKTESVTTNTVKKDTSVKDLAELVIPKRNNVAHKKPKHQKPVRIVKELARETKQNEPDFAEAQRLFNIGNYPEAEEIIQKLISENPNQELLMLNARTKANLGKLDEALVLCKSLLSINRLSPEIYYLHAIIQAEQGDVEAAYTSLKKSFYLDSAFVITNFMLGKFAEYLNKNEESEKYFNNTLDLLNNMHEDDIVPESDGMTAGRLREVIMATSKI